jgi:hypothetical protein
MPTDLAVEGRDRRRVDDHAALAICPWCDRRHRRCSLGHHVERADDIEILDEPEGIEIVG